MRVITAGDLDRILTYPALIEALREGFRSDITVPVRHHHPIKQPGAEAMLLLMPAWGSGPGSFLGTKVVTVFPDNGKISKAAVLGSYILMSGETGEPLAIIDGTSLTVNTVSDNRFTVNIIPHTLEVTTWGQKRAGDRLNMEVDLIARYVARLTGQKRSDA